METVIRKAPLTLRQQIALAYLNSSKERNLQVAVGNLQADQGLGNVIPEWLWQRLAKDAIRKGNPTALRQAYEHFGTGAPTPAMYVRCGKNALKNLDVFLVIEAYEKAGTPIPCRAFKNVAEILLIKAATDEKVELRAALKVYSYLGIKPPIELLLAVLEIAKQKKYLGWYTKMCEQLGVKTEKVTLQTFFDYYVSEFSVDGIEETAELLKKKLGKKFLIALAKKAFSQEKYDEGKELFELAYKK